MADDVEVTQDDREAAIFLLEEEGEDHMVRQIRTYGEECDHWPQVQAFARHRIASVRAAAMSDLIAGDADLYDTPSARITGDKDRENPVEGAQPAPSDDLVAKVGMALCENALGGKRCPCVEKGVFSCADAYPGYQAHAAIAAVGQDTRSQVEREIVKNIRATMRDCSGKFIADAIEQGQYRSEGDGN